MFSDAPGCQCHFVGFWIHYLIALSALNNCIRPIRVSTVKNDKEWLGVGLRRLIKVYIVCKAMTFSLSLYIRKKNPQQY